MKKIFILIIFTQSIFSVFSQDTNIVTLDYCYSKTKENFALSKQSEFNSATYELSIKNIQTTYYPTINLVGQATYQSNAIELNIPIPNLEMPEVPLDQYKVYLEINQLIYDGGYSKSQKQIENINLQSNNKSLDIEFQSLKEQINQIYFMLLLFDKHYEILQVLHQNLEIQLTRVNICMKNEILKPVNRDIIQAQILMVEQNMIEIRAGKDASIKILEELTGTKLGENPKLEYPEIELNLTDTIISRPELEMLDIQQQKIEALSQITKASRRPKLGAFAQAGYGRPGPNMLSDEFSPYFIVGAKISWNIFDWNKSKRQQKILSIQHQNVDIKKENFETKINIELQSIISTISILEQQIEKDIEIIEVRNKIVNTYSSQLQNGIITSSEYITELNAVTQAKLNLEIHKIQLIKAKINYQTIK